MSRTQPDPPGPDQARRYGGRIPTAALLSFRLGGSDGVAIEAAKWASALEILGFTTITVAGQGPVDVIVPGLEIDAPSPPDRAALSSALAEADLVVVENLCSLPLNQAAWDMTAEVLASRPAVLHHHDLPWQRPQFLEHHGPPDDAAWRHVTINDLSRRELAARGITATTVYNSFAMPAIDLDGHLPVRSDEGRAVRMALGVPDDERLVLQPTRALARKGVAVGMAAAARLGATFWLLGPAEDGYGPELEHLMAEAPCRIVRGMPNLPSRGGPATIDDAYDACDVVALPSTWEGFGNPSLESVIHHRPLIIGPYPVAKELQRFGFDWFMLDQPDAIDRLDAWLTDPEPELLQANLTAATEQFSLADLPARIQAILPPI